MPLLARITTTVLRRVSQVMSGAYRDDARAIGASSRPLHARAPLSPDHVVADAESLHPSGPDGGPLGAEVEHAGLVAPRGRAWPAGGWSGPVIVSTRRRYGGDWARI